MESQDYPISHLAEMQALWEKARELPAQVLVHEYTFESFGSWFTVFQIRGQRLRAVFDGKEGELRFEKPIGESRFNKWHQTEWKTSIPADGHLDSSEFIQLLLLCSAS